MASIWPAVTAGIAVCLLIFVIIRFETSFDTFHHDAGKLYRIISEYHHQGDTRVTDGATVPAPLPSLFAGDRPGNGGL